MSNNTIEENLITEPVKKVRDHRGQRNPHYGHAMQPASREAIAQKQRLRFDLLRSAIEQSKNSVSEERVREIIIETVQDYLSQNAVQTNNNRPNIPL